MLPLSRKATFRLYLLITTILYGMMEHWEELLFKISLCVYLTALHVTFWFF